MADGVYTAFGVRALPAGDEAPRRAMAALPRGVGYVCVTLWMMLVMLVRGAADA